MGGFLFGINPWYIPIPAVPPYNIRTLHIRGIRTTKQQTSWKQTIKHQDGYIGGQHIHINLRNQERDWPSLLRCCKIQQPEKCMRTMKHQKPPKRKVSKTMHTFVNFMKHEKTPKWKVCKTPHTFVNFIKHEKTPKWKVFKKPHTFANFMQARSQPEALSSQKWAKYKGHSSIL